MDDEFARHKKAYDNQEKIKEALDHINNFLAERKKIKSYDLKKRILLSDITDIKEILEK